jgi:predicted XRE-type DNA-binding protein
MSHKVTPEMAAMVKAMLIHLNVDQHEIAAKMGINQGRVSEINTGHRFADVQPASVAELVNWCVPRGLVVS